MVVENDFVNIKEFNDISKKILHKIKNSENTRVLRGYKGNPCFVVENRDEIILELRPTENSNYMLYKRDSSGSLDPTQKFEELNAGLKHLSTLL
jgi:hypothetical protein